MQENYKEPVQEVSENTGNRNDEFEAEQNLVGVFSILLEWDKRVNPQNYGLEYNQNEND